jgi:hypothetical protein
MSVLIPTSARERNFGHDQLEGMAVWCELAHRDEGDIDTFVEGDDLVAVDSQDGAEARFDWEGKADLPELRS